LLAFFFFPRYKARRDRYIAYIIDKGGERLLVGNGL
jgi:hypothetical protein